MSTSKAKRALSIPEVVQLIEVCAKNGVSSLKFLELDVSFDKAVQTIQVLENPTRVPEEEILKTERESLEREEEDFRENQIAEMMLRDPMMAEKLIAEGELEDLKDDAEKTEED